MDLKRLKSVFDRLELLDDRLTYRVRPSSGSLNRASLEQLEDKHRLLAEYATELKDILRDVILAVAAKPPAAKP